MRDEELRSQPFPDTFDNTMLSTYAECPRRLYWFLRGLDYQIPPSYFTWGRCWGLVLNTWYETQGSVRERFEAAIKTGKKAWLEEALPDAEEMSKLDTWENLEASFLDYIEAYGPQEHWHHVKGGAELGFQFPVPGTEIYYAGSIDAYIEWTGYGKLVREDKSTGAYITETYLRQWRHSSQVTGYYWALGQLLGEEPFGVLMNITSKRPRKERDLRFQRDLIKKSPWQVEQFMKDTILLAARIQESWKTWTWPKLGERLLYACSGGPGKSACLYQNLCLQEAEPWELEDKYDFSQEFLWREHPWKPWRRKGEGK